MATTGAWRRRQKYPDELRVRAVRMVFEIRDETGESHGVITRAVREFGIGTESVRGWVNQVDVDSSCRPATSTADGQRIAELEREVEELRRAHDILKAASVFFVTELVAPCTYYSAESRPSSPRAVRDAVLGPKLKELWEDNYSVYGRRKLTVAAHRADLDVGRNQVARLMRLQAIVGASRAVKRFTTRSDPTAVRASNFVKRDFTATQPDALWVADFTYCSTWSRIRLPRVRHRCVLSTARRLETSPDDARRAGP
jgi:transposase-like protein